MCIYSKVNAKISKNKSLPANFPDIEFNLQTRLVFFLPTRSSSGLVSYSLLHYLFSLQNEMLHFYRDVAKIAHFERKKADMFENKELLITFNKNTDLSRIVLSNFTYDSKNLKFVFKYSTIEYQVIDRFIRTKPDIDLNVSVFEYFGFFRNFGILKSLLHFLDDSFVRVLGRNQRRFRVQKAQRYCQSVFDPVKIAARHLELFQKDKRLVRSTQ
jgi:hypothetical protein